MRLRNAEQILAQLQQELEAAGHPEGDRYRAAKISAFWQKLQSDYLKTKGE
jgi:hypothetical protein